MSTALPVVVTLAGLVLAGCGDARDDVRGVAQVAATATTNVRTTSHPEAPSVTPTPSGSTSATPPATPSAAPPASTAETTAEPITTTTAAAAATPVEHRAAPEPVAPVRGDVEAAEARVFTLTNDQRAAHGCPVLGVDERLNRAARGHSADMAAQNYFDHRSKDGRTFVDRVKAAGHPSPGAENIAAGQRTPEEVVKGWMESPGHRANILNCELKALGVGMARGGSYGVYWTQNFGW
ncbi:CAP domain-containing protein [Actinosynnema sp. NPDC023587]|uniref:CAP domain-containing protein n=1 Tax=Actinosynnema sp. NPDC023587 TaxID=3154695 RepID=UPI0034096496